MSRLNNYIRFEDTIPDKNDAWDSILSCECDKVSTLIWSAYCDRCNGWNGITEEEWEEWCKANGFPYRAAGFTVKDNNNEDIMDDYLLIDAPKPTKKQIKRDRKERYQNHLKQIQVRSRYWISGAWPVDKDGNYVSDDSPEFVRFKRGYRGKRSKQLKRRYNKALRRIKDVPLKGNGYRKSSGDFWWDLW